MCIISLIRSSALWKKTMDGEARSASAMKPMPFWKQAVDLKKAAHFFSNAVAPVVIINVDILTDMDL